MKRFLGVALVFLSACGGSPDPAQPLEGTITGISYTDNLCFLDVGRQDGVKVGQLFSVLSDGKEVAVISADAIEEGTCGCRERREYRHAAPEKGDRVRAK